MLEVKQVVNNDEWFQIDEMWCCTKLQRSLQFVWSWNECIDYVLSVQKWGSPNLSVPVCVKDRSLVENEPFDFQPNLTLQNLTSAEDSVTVLPGRLSIECKIVLWTYLYLLKILSATFRRFGTNIRCERHSESFGARWIVVVEWVF